MLNFDRLNNIQKNGLKNFFKIWEDLEKKGYSPFPDVKSEIVLNNFYKDHFLNFDSYEEIVEILINEKAPFKNHIWEVIKYIWKNHLFEGEKIETTPAKMGTVMIKPTLSDYLLQEYPNQFETPLDVDTFINKAPEKYDDIEKKMTLKKSGYHIWVTWEENNRKASPFVFSTNRDKNEICDALGLADFYFDNDRLLIVFENVENRKMHKPTIADANLHNSLWRPTPVSFQAFGLTEPRTINSLCSGYEKSRPEAVIVSDDLKCKYISGKINNHN